MARTYHVEKYVWNEYSDHIKGSVSEYKVSDRLEDEREEHRPTVAVFPVNALYDEESQKVRSHKLAEYLNKVQEKIDVITLLQGEHV